MQEPCKRSAGLCRETARGLQEACGGPACRESSLPCSSLAGELQGHCQTTARGDLKGICKETARGLRACGGPACKESSMPCSAPAGEPQGNCKPTARRTPTESAREMHEACRGLLRNGKGSAGMCRGSGRGLFMQGPCLQGIFTALQLAGKLQQGACRGAAGQPHGNCKGACRESARDPQGLC